MLQGLKVTLHHLTYLMVPTRAFEGFPEEIHPAPALQGASIDMLQGFLPFLRFRSFTGAEMEFSLGILQADVLPIAVWLSSLRHICNHT